MCADYITPWYKPKNSFRGGSEKKGSPSLTQRLAEWTMTKKAEWTMTKKVTLGSCEPRVQIITNHTHFSCHCFCTIPYSCLKIIPSSTLYGLNCSTFIVESNTINKVHKGKSLIGAGAAFCGPLVRRNLWEVHPERLRGRHREQRALRLHRGSLLVY